MTADTITAIKKALESVTPDRVERLWWFLHIISKSGGATDATDDKWNWINAFCHDFEDDTFNRASDLGFISVSFDSIMETSTAKMTPAGNAFIAYFDKAPSASANATLESLQRENAALIRERDELQQEANELVVAQYTISAKDAEIKRLEEWRPIAEADNGIAYVHKLPEMQIGCSYPTWVRDADGRVYEALWSDNGKKAYWWDIEGESPVDPVEFMPHPLSRAALSSTGDTHGN